MQSGGGAVARFENKTIIGLTGNIAVGKSVVRRMMQHLGAYTIDADGLTHQAMMPGAPAYKPVIEMFGRYVVDANGQINRTKLGAIVFNLPDALATLERIIHPIVGSAVSTLISRATQKVVVVEAIKLLEGNLTQLCDAIWVVDAPPEMQLARLIQKREMSEVEARKRIAAQNPQADKLARADVVIYNGTDVDSTWKQVQDAYNRIGAPPQPVVPPPPPVQQPAASTPTITPIAPAPAPVISPALRTDTQELVMVDGVRARRGTPNHAEEIAKFISAHSGKEVSRMDIMLGFGQKSYFMGQDTGGKVIALIGWQVENLITTIDELYFAPEAPRAAAVTAIMAQVEESARSLQSEVGFVFLPSSGDPSVRAAFVNNGYQSLKVDEMTSPAWREAAHEQLRDGITGLYKVLRPDRVTKPI
jgi:dephospho-CoA kinase